MKFLFLFCLFFLPYITKSQTKTGCLVQGASQLYTNSIGNRNPYWAGDTNPSTPAYNGTQAAGTYVPVDNRLIQDVPCGSWYIKSTTGTGCLQYTNGSPPTFVSKGGNGVIATVEKKCGTVSVPLDDYIFLIVVLLAGLGYYHITKKQNATAIS